MKSKLGFMALGIAVSLAGGVFALGCGGSSHHSGGGGSTTNTTGTNTTGTNTTGTNTTGTNTTGTNTTGTNTTGTNTTGTNTTGTNTTGTNNTGSGSTDPHVQAALNQINASRATQSLPALTLDTSMSTCALRHAQDCAGCAGDQLSNFASCAHGDFKAGDTCGGNSENQGVASGVPQDQGFTEVHQAMMAEGPPPAGQDNHFANIMNKTATAVGIGLFVDPNGTLWLSEEFR